MTRYTNNGRKRTYLQASFDPNDDTKAASASVLGSSDPLQAQQEVRVGALPEPSHKRRRRSKVGSEEEKIAVDPFTAAVENDGNDKPTLKSEKKKKALEKLKAKEKAKRAKSTLSYL